MPQITRVLCPIDFSESSVHALEQAAVVAGWYHAHLTALHVSSPIFMAVPGLPAPVDRVSEPERERIRMQGTAFVQSALGHETSYFSVKK